jgi:hypothetical protein
MRQNELKFNPACMRMSNLKIKYFGGKRNMFVMGHSKPKSNPDSAGMPNLKIKSNIKFGHVLGATKEIKNQSCLQRDAKP